MSARDDSRGKFKKHKFNNKNGKKKLFTRKTKKITIVDEIKHLQSAYNEVDSTNISKFKDIPLSSKTLKGLSDNDFISPTEIQRESIVYSLRGEDILGAAHTGSGKTLAFLIPVLEILYCKQWTHLDGLGALIITPTRELAYQIYETLLKVGKHHDFSAGLIIGGKDLHFEKKRMDQCNIVICTPGRILHHMDINPLFDCSNMQVLVLDEADRCLDLGFQETMNSIIENLPPERQTLLFSATQTKSVKDLARLSLKNPRYVSVHENKEHSTPDSLVQSYMVCEQHDKINLLWSFIKNHKRQKILIFMSSCKQVKYIFELFCRLRPGSPLLALYGTLHQLRRMKIYKEFCSKQNVVMFATDIAARGLDFPAVNWVVQLDCPEDANTYIHRAGRTARYTKGGESLLVLLPSEERAMIEELETKKIPISEIKVNPNKLMSPIKKIEALVARDPNLKADAQRAFLAYIKAVYLMKNKNIFNVKGIDVEQFATSLGLVVTPRIRFLRREEKRSQREVQVESENEEESHEERENKGEDTGFQDSEDSDGEISDSGFLKVKRRNHELDSISALTEEETRQLSEGKKKKAVITKANIAKRVLKKKIVANKKTVFDEEGDAVLKKGREKISEVAKKYEMENEGGGINIEEAKEVLREEDRFDKELFRERIKAKHKSEKRKLKEMEEDNVEEAEVDEESEEEEESGSEPDLSWLPDPDRVYSNKEDEQSSKSGQSESESSDSEQTIHQLPKRKLVDKSDLNKPKKIKVFDTGLSLAEDEELALKLLHASK